MRRMQTCGWQGDCVPGSRNRTFRGPERGQVLAYLKNGMGPGQSVLERLGRDEGLVGLGEDMRQ